MQVNIIWRVSSQLIKNRKRWINSTFIYIKEEWCFLYSRDIKWWILSYWEKTKSIVHLLFKITFLRRWHLLTNKNIRRKITSGFAHTFCLNDKKPCLARYYEVLGRYWIIWIFKDKNIARSNCIKRINILSKKNPFPGKPKSNRKPFRKLLDVSEKGFRCLKTFLKIPFWTSLKYS